MDAFETYFRQADANGDGQISGAEAVAFFRGSGLPQIVLAKIWQLADRTQRGFLSRPEFVHALKLVTVAQSGRELTPEIARAALSGPASSQIPPPRIVPSQQPPVTAVPPSPNRVVQPQGPAPVAPSPVYRPPLQNPLLQNQRVSYVGQQVLPSETPRPQFQASQQQWRPQPIPASGSAQNNFGGSVFQAVPDVSKPLPVSSGNNPATVGLSAPTPGNNAVSAAMAADVFGGDAFKAGSADAFGGDAFSANNNQRGEKAIVPVAPQTPTPSSVASSSAIVPVTPLGQTSTSSAGHTPPPQVFRPPVQASGAPTHGYVVPPVHTVQQPAAAPGVTWPRMVQADVERYSKIFTGVDTDRDGKIRGDQARDLFLSWGLPRDVLKQIWDLSDQDGDSMLSLREFCIALYFMERYREGRPVPPVLPTGFLPEGPAPQQWQPVPVRPPVLSPQPGRTAWQQESASGGVLPGSQAAGLMPLQASPADTADSQPIQYKPRAPPLEAELVNQLSREDQSTLKSKHQEAEAADRKVFDLEKDIKDATEKIAFYRAKLQEIIMFKTRSDNHLLEITERLAADKREVDALRKKYDEKFQKAGGANSRLMAEQAAFRDIQQRKMDLYNAIAKIDQGGKEGLQERAEQISADLEELKRLLSQRAKSLGLRARPSSAMELPFGWQPGIQEHAVDWDDWDKFEDEGFTYFQQTEETIAEKPKEDEKAAVPEKLENGPLENGEKGPLENGEKPEEKRESPEGKPEEKLEQVNEVKNEQKTEEALEKDQKDKQTPTSAPSWSNVFGDEPDWNLSQDFGKSGTFGNGNSGGFVGLKSIKTSAPVGRTGDASVPETPLFSSSVPGTPLFSASVPDTPLFSAVSPPSISAADSFRLGDESLPETPLFSDGNSSSRNAFARFDSISSDFSRTSGIFDDPGTSFEGSTRWSTF